MAAKSKGCTGSCGGGCTINKEGDGVGVLFSTKQKQRGGKESIIILPACGVAGSIADWRAIVACVYYRGFGVGSGLSWVVYQKEIPIDKLHMLLSIHCDRAQASLRAAQSGLSPREERASYTSGYPELLSSLAVLVRAKDCKALELNAIA